MFILDAISNAVESVALGVEAGIAELSNIALEARFDESDHSNEEDDGITDEEMEWIQNTVKETLDISARAGQALLLKPDDILDILHGEKQEMDEPEPMKDLLSDDSKKVIAELSKLNDDNLSDDEKAKIIAGLKGKTITLNVDKLIGAADTR